MSMAAVAAGEFSRGRALGLDAGAVFSAGTVGLRIAKVAAVTCAVLRGVMLVPVAVAVPVCQV